jgi:hypothetical protein
MKKLTILECTGTCTTTATNKMNEKLEAKLAMFRAFLACFSLIADQIALRSNANSNSELRYFYIDWRRTD